VNAKMDQANSDVNGVETGRKIEIAAALSAN
jgi:hypothetical protein